MTKLVWNQPGERFYETGVDRGVLYPQPGNVGVAWNGLIAVNERTAGGEAEPLHYDGDKYFDLVKNEDYQADLEAFSAPEEFSVCDGSLAVAAGLYVTHQPRKTFGLSYRTKIGNDVNGEDHGYKLHLVYDATAAPSEKARQTVTNQPQPTTFRWTIDAVPAREGGTFKPTAHLVIDSTKADPTGLSELEDALYGTDLAQPQLPTQTAVYLLLA